MRLHTTIRVGQGSAENSAELVQLRLQDRRTRRLHHLRALLDQPGVPDWPYHCFGAGPFRTCRNHQL